MDYALTVGLLGGIGVPAYLFYSVFALDSGAWKRVKRRLLDVAAEQGLSSVSQAAAEGTLEGLQFRLALGRRRGTKSETYVLRGTLDVEGWTSVKVQPESVLSGAQRLMGERESVLSDPELDACFWMEGQPEELRRLFSSPIREAMLLAFPELPAPTLAGGKITSELFLLTPFFVNGRLRSMIAAFRVLAGAFAGKAASLQARPGLAIRRKLRRFSLTSLALFGPACLVAQAMPGDRVMALQAIFLLGLALSTFGITGRQTARTLLQAYYAFLTLLFPVLLLAHLVGILGPPASSRTLGVLLGGGVLTSIFWSARHYLRALDTTGVVTATETPRTGSF